MKTNLIFISTLKKASFICFLFAFYLPFSTWAQNNTETTDSNYSPFIRINTGGTEVAATDGDVNWSANTTVGAFTSNLFAVNTGVIGTHELSYTNKHSSIPSYIDEATFNAIFTNERWDNSTGEEMEFSIPVPNNTYLVNLFLGNGFSGAAEEGDRIYDILIENEIVQNDLDLIAMFGHQAGGMLSFVVNVEDELLNISFGHEVENPLINAIEIQIADADFEPFWIDKDENEDYVARHECSFVQAGDQFIIFGGRESAQRLDMYDYESDTWSTGAEAPLEFNHFQAITYQNLVWVIGAFQNNSFPNEVPADHIYTYNPITDEWIEGAEIPEDRRRGGAGLVMYKDKFYLVGGNTIGHNGGYVPWTDEYDPATNEWTVLDDAPHARDHFHAVEKDGKIYAVSGRLSGGDGGTFAPLVEEVDIFDLETMTWSTLPSQFNLPTPRAGASVALFENEIYVIGGEGEESGPAFATVEAFDPTSSIWSVKEPLNHARHGTQAIVSGDGIHIACGSPNRGGGRQLNMEVYNIDNPVSNFIEIIDICENLSNIALNKTAIQSTTSSGGIAQRAVDGNTSGIWGDGSITHTAGTPGSTNPWWRVDLNGNFTIEEIVINNRTDCCSDRLDGAIVYIGNVDSTDPSDFTEIDTLDSTAMQTFDNLNVDGSFVMVQIPGEDKILSLAEVQVFGCSNTFSSSSTASQLITNSLNSASQINNFDTNSILVYPNPAINELNIDLASYMNHSIHYSINSIVGNQIGSGIFRNNHSIVEQIGLENIPSGIYFLNFNIEGKDPVVVKFVVM